MSIFTYHILIYSRWYVLFYLQQWKMNCFYFVGINGGRYPLTIGNEDNLLFHLSTYTSCDCANISSYCTLSKPFYCKVPLVFDQQFADLWASVCFWVQTCVQGYQCCGCEVIHTISLTSVFVYLHFHRTVLTSRGQHPSILMLNWLLVSDRLAVDMLICATIDPPSLFDYWTTASFGRSWN